MKIQIIKFDHFKKNKFVAVIMAGIIWLLLVSVIYILTVSIAGPLVPDGSKKLLRDFLFTIGVAVGLVGVSIFLIYSLTAEEKYELKGLFNLSEVGVRTWIVVSMFLSLAILGTSVVFVFNLSDLKNETEPSLLYELWKPQDPLRLMAFVFVFLHLFVLAPLFQELFFRFYLIKAFRKHFSISFAAFLGSTVYAMFQAQLSDPIQIMLFLVLGLILSSLYVFSRSLIPSILFNFFIVLSAYIALFKS